MRIPFASILVLAGSIGFAAETETPTPPVPDSRAVMTGEQVIQILDETVDWYRTLGMQQQAATQPSDLLILYANRQTADKVVALAFEIARANAELLSSEASERAANDEATSPQSLSKRQAQLDAERKQIQAEIANVRGQLAAASKQDRVDLEARIAALQGELDLVAARRNYLDNMVRFAYESDADDFGANALKAHIDAVAASIPSASGSSTSTPAAPASTATSSAASISLGQFGIWELTATVLRLSAKARTIETVDARTAQLQDLFTQIRTPPLDKLQELTERGEALAEQAQQPDRANLRSVRDQYDTLAWLFQQTSAIATPLSKAGVLLDQYRSNLENWREVIDRQYREALKMLGLRLVLFGGLLIIVLAAAHLWRRAVFHYVHEPRRRSRLLIVQKVVVWILIVAIAASTFATELGSLATFAGLITAGLAVAMQSVLVSIVGYFFLIGKYGVRVGDRVQIGNVTGEVIDMGLVRMHLMELSGQPALSPTGRVVAFANSIIFQASGGLFKQIPGVNLAWHEITLVLPAAADYATIKEELLAAVTRVISDYRDDILRQAREIQKASSNETGEPQPQVQLRFAASGVDAVVRYPVQLSLAAEIDERVSRELLGVVSKFGRENALPSTAGA